jgi:hypothetical protein
MLHCVVQGAIFSAIGFSAGLTGTAISNCLLFARKTLDPNFKVQVRGDCLRARR